MDGLTRSPGGRLFPTQDQRKHQEEGESDEDDAYGLVDDVEDACSEEALQHGGKLALDDIEADRGEEHANKEEIEAVLLETEGARGKGDNREPIDPHERIEEVDGKPSEPYDQSIGSVFGAELHDGAFRLGILGLAREEIDAKTSQDTTTDQGHIDVVEDGGHGDIVKDGEEEEAGGPVAEVDAKSQGARFLETVVHAGLEQGEESRSKTIDERDDDSAADA